MNEINVKRMVLAGLCMLIVWVMVEILVEHVLARILFGQTYQEMWLQVIEPKDWDASNYWINIFVAVVNCTLMIWIYASLRPMYGVGTKTALIVSAFSAIWVFSLFVNLTNLGLFPLKLGLIEATFEAIEFPIAMMAGAAIYENREKWDQPAE
jgi:hypothetical protein